MNSLCNLKFLFPYQNGNPKYVAGYWLAVMARQQDSYQLIMSGYLAKGKVREPQSWRRLRSISQRSPTQLQFKKLQLLTRQKSKKLPLSLCLLTQIKVLLHPTLLCSVETNRNFDTCEVFIKEIGLCLPVTLQVAIQQ